MIFAERWELVILAGCVCKWKGVPDGWVLAARHPSCRTDHGEPPDRRPDMKRFDDLWRIKLLFFGRTDWWLCRQTGHPFRTRIRRWSQGAEAAWWAENYPERES